MLCPSCQATLRSSSAWSDTLLQQRFHNVVCVQLNMSQGIVRLLFLCGRILLHRTLHILDTAREPLVNCVAKSGPHSTIVSSDGVRPCSSRSAQAKLLSSPTPLILQESPVSSPRVPGASSVAVVCFDPASVTSTWLSVGIAACPSNSVGKFSTVSIPSLEAAVPSVEDDTERPPFATLIFV